MTKNCGSHYGFITKNTEKNTVTQQHRISFKDGKPKNFLVLLLKTH